MGSAFQSGTAQLFMTSKTVMATSETKHVFLLNIVIESQSHNISQCKWPFTNGHLQLNVNVNYSMILKWPDQVLISGGQSE